MFNRPTCCTSFSLLSWCGVNAALMPRLNTPWLSKVLELQAALYDCFTQVTYRPLNATMNVSFGSGPAGQVVAITRSGAIRIGAHVGAITQPVVNRVFLSLWCEENAPLLREKSAGASSATSNPKPVHGCFFCSDSAEHSETAHLLHHCCSQGTPS